MRLALVMLVVVGCSSKGSNKGDTAVPPAEVLPPAADAICSVDHWCWELPRIQGNGLHAAVAIARDNIWAVGDHGTILHFNGTSWPRVAAPTTHDLRGIWAASAHDLWAVGSDGNFPVILRGDGAVWRTVALPVKGVAYDDVWGSGPNDVWVVGHGGAMLHWDGKALREVASGVHHYLHSVWGTGPNDVIAVGDEGALIHWDGKTWTRISTTSNDLTGIRDGWITGDDTTVLRWNGRTAEPVHHDSDGHSQGVPFSIGGTLWIPQTSYDRPMRQVGTTFENVDALGGHHVEAFTGVAADDVWALGEGGFIAHWDGRTWSIVREDDAPSSIAVGDAIWAARYRAVHRRTAAGWSVMRQNDGFGTPFALGADVWLPLGDKLAHWDGSDWRDEPISDSPSQVWARAPDDIWVTASRGNVLRFDGKRWSSGIVDPEGGTFYAIWGIGPRDVWVAGGNGLYHHDGRSWSPTGIERVFDVHGSGAADAWAVTDSVVVHWDGKAWTQAVKVEGAQFSAVHATSPREVYVGDRLGGIRRWDGTAWIAEDTGTGCPIESLASKADSVWVATGCGVLRRNRRVGP